MRGRGERSHSSFIEIAKFRMFGGFAMSLEKVQWCSAFRFNCVHMHAILKPISCLKNSLLTLF